MDSFVTYGAVRRHHQVGDDPLLAGELEAAEPVRRMPGRDGVGQDRPEMERHPAVVGGPGRHEDVPVDQLVAVGFDAAVMDRYEGWWE